MKRGGWLCKGDYLNKLVTSRLLLLLLQLWPVLPGPIIAGTPVENSKASTVGKLVAEVRWCISAREEKSQMVRINGGHRGNPAGLNVPGLRCSDEDAGTPEYALLALSPLSV